jgi:mannitol/fructose-specific phosphotransferase system IIA component (Ntr-type)
MPPSESTLQGTAAVSMMEYTRPELIVPGLRETDTAGIIGQLSEALQRQRVVPDLLPFYHAALNQELLHNSALESGIAIPHARLAGVKQLQFAFGRAALPVTWGVKGSWAVQFVFLVAVPASDSATYLHLLAGIARLSQQTQQLSELRKAKGAEDFLAVFERVRLRPR